MEGPIEKMVTRLAQPVQYQLPMGDDLVDLNPLIGSELTLSYTGKISCIACGRKTNKSFNQGYCYPCFKRLAACDQCIVRPELCHFHEGTCREPDWGKAQCFGPHVVYLANSSGLKVGITRASQLPTRWIDQGASQALPIFEVTDRRTAGLVEAHMRSFVSDRTDWRKMLKGSPAPVALEDERERLLLAVREFIDPLNEEADAIKVRPAVDHAVCEITFPVDEYPQKVKTHNFDKAPSVSGRLTGIKGQYLMMGDLVFNVRKFAGYVMELKS